MPNTDTDGKTRTNWFFVGMAALLIVIVAVGFAPSFYLRGAFTSDPSTVTSPGVPAYIVVHAIALTLWYLLFFVQTVLVATKRVHIHRTLGLAGAALAALIVPLSFTVIVRSVARSNLGALPVIGDLGILTLFAILVIVSIRRRRKSDVHKRLMLIASIAFTAPAFARWPGAEAAVPLSVIVPQLSLYTALMVHDIVTRRRVHPATGWGVLAYVIVLGTCVPLAMSDLGKQLIDFLR